MKLDINAVISICLAGPLFVFFIFLLIIAAYDDAKRNPQPRRRKRRRTEQKSPDELDSLDVPIGVLALTHNRQAAYRLFIDVSGRFPGKSAHWVWDKVRYDIIRDRN